MSQVVVDASIGLTWCFPDETSDYVDAAYLELSIRHRIPLATLDNKLRHAAKLAGAGLFLI